MAIPNSVLDDVNNALNTESLTDIFNQTWFNESTNSGEPSINLEEPSEVNLTSNQLNQCLVTVNSIRNKRKSIDDNIKLATAAITDMSSKIDNIKKESNEIKALENSLEGRKKRIESSYECVTRKITSYDEMAKRYMQDKKECIEDLERLKNIANGAVNHRDPNLATLKTQIDHEKSMLNNISTTEISELYDRTMYLDFH